MYVDADGTGVSFVLISVAGFSSLEKRKGISNHQFLNIGKYIEQKTVG